MSPWYPDDASPYSGVFVEKQVVALRSLGHDVSVEVPMIFPAPRGPIPIEVREAIRELGSSHPDDMYLRRDEATYVPTPVPSQSGYIGRAHAFAASLATKRDVLPVEVDVTHSHLGVPTAWALLTMGVSPLVVTEHQSTLPAVFREVAAAEAYRETIENADAFICVSGHLKRQIADRFGTWVNEKIEVVPNIVDVSHIPYDGNRGRDFRSWLYVGGLAPHKGIESLLWTFLDYRRTVERRATLTLVGTGVMRSWVEQFAKSNEVAEAVRLVGAVPHEDVGSHLAAADLFVHLSPRETFGIASLEAIAAGLPVVSARNDGAVSTWGAIESTCGILVEPGSRPESVVRRIAGMRDDPSRLEPDKARQFVEQSFGPRLVADALVSVYQRCLA